MKTTLETSGEDVKTTLETSGEDMQMVEPWLLLLFFVQVHALLSFCEANLLHSF